MVSNTSATESSKQTGRQIVLACLIVQVAFGLLFTAVGGVFHRRICKVFTSSGVSQETRWLTTLYGIMVLITVRNIFRIVEYSGGQGLFYIETRVLAIYFRCCAYIVGTTLFKLASSLPDEEAWPCWVSINKRCNLGQRPVDAEGRHLRSLLEIISCLIKSKILLILSRQ